MLLSYIKIKDEIEELKREIEKIKIENTEFRKRQLSLQEYNLYVVENGKRATICCEKEYVTSSVCVFWVLFSVVFPYNKEIKKIFVAKIYGNCEDRNFYNSPDAEIIKETEDYICAKIDNGCNGYKYYQVNKNDCSVADVTRFYEEKNK